MKATVSVLKRATLTLGLPSRDVSSEYEPLYEHLVLLAIENTVQEIITRLTGSSGGLFFGI